MPRPAPGYGSSRTFTQKLGIYLLGIAIGLMLLGWFQWRKHQAAASRAGPVTTPAAEAHTQPQPPPADPG